MGGRGQYATIQAFLFLQEQPAWRTLKEKSFSYYKWKLEEEPW
jgi:hypothetical protein